MTLLFTLLVLCCSASVCFCSPVLSRITAPNAEFRSSVQDAQSLAGKMLRNIPAVYESCVRTPFTNDLLSLEYIRETLEIPTPPKLAPISETHTLEVNLERISEGLQLHQRLLQEVKEEVDCSGEITALVAEITDLNTHINKVQVLGGFPVSKPQLISVPVLSALTKDRYHLNVGVHLLLDQFRAFTQDTVRSLREIQHLHSHLHISA